MQKSPVLPALIFFFGTLIALGIGTAVGWNLRGTQDVERYGIFLEKYETEAQADEAWKLWAAAQGDGSFSMEVNELQAGGWVVTSLEEQRD